MSSDNTFVCPSCRQLDRVQKVSSIVSSGTASISTSGTTSVRVDGETHYGSVSQSGTSTTELARKLAKPSEPSGGCNPNFWWTVELTCLFLILGSIGSALPLISIGGLALIGIVGSLALTIGFISIFKRVHVFFVRKEKAKELIREAAMQEYNKRLATWNAMFYCYRCDGVFTRSSRFAAIANVAEFLSKG